MSSPSDTRDNVATAKLALSAGEKKYHDGFVNQFFKAVYGGALLTFGGNVALVVGASPALQSSDPGLAKIAFGKRWRRSVLLTWQPPSSPSVRDDADRSG